MPDVARRTGDTVPGVRSLVGRDAALATLQAAIAASDAGHGGVVLVMGEAGVGKTRLLAEAAHQASAQGLTVLSGRAVRGGGAFRPLIEALVAAVPATLSSAERLAPHRAVLAQLLPGWSTELPVGVPLADPVVVLGEAVLELLVVRAGGGGLVLVLDDLHLADRDTVGLLGYLAGRVPDSGVLLVLASRDDEPGAQRLWGALGHADVERLALDRLEEAEVLALAAQRHGGVLSAEFAARVVAASDGLPLLVEELVAAADAGAAGVPGTLVELTRQRLASLSEDDRAVVVTAAVLGADVDWRLLAPACDCDDDEAATALRAAVTAGLLVVDPSAPGSLRWRHTLTREAVLGMLLPVERAALARRAASRLSGDGQLDGERLEVVAELLVVGGAGAEAARLLVAVARSAVDAGALGSAEDTLRRAALLAGGGELERDVTLELVRVLALAGRVDEAEGLGAGLADVLEGSGLVELRVYLARAAVVAGRFADAGRHLAAIASDDDPHVAAIRAHVALADGDVSAALDLADRAIESGDRLDQPSAVCEGLEIVGRAQRRTDPPAAQAAFARAERLARRHGLTPWRIRALSELGALDMLQRGRRDRLERARHLAVGAGMAVTATVLDIQLSACVLLNDGPVAALPWAQRAADQAELLGLRAAGAAAHHFIARARLFAGEPFDDDLAAAEALSPGSADGATFVGGLRGLAAWLDRDEDAALAAFDDSVAAGRDDVTVSATPTWGVWALMRVLADPADPAAEQLRRSAVLVHAGNRAALRYLDAVAAARAGDPARSDELFDEGDEELAGSPFWRHLLHMMLAEHAVDEGFGSPAEWLREALTFLEPTGETRLVQLCRALMRESGQAVPRAGTGVTAPLRRLGITAREAEVLELVRQGLTNAEIAGRLYLSTRTVESHVAHLLSKTGTENRRSLAGLAP